MGKYAKIRILDSVHCRVDADARRLIAPAVTVKVSARKRTRFGFRPDIRNKTLMTGRDGTSGLLLTGLLPRILERYGDKIKIVGSEEQIIPNNPFPKVKGIKFRPDQRRAFRMVRKKSRGLVVFPTGTGKTIMALGFFCMYSDRTILFLCHTRDLVEQTKGEMKKFGFEYTEIKKEHKWVQKPQILISTIQTFSKIPAKSYSHLIDVVIVDEVHHANTTKSQYGNALQKMLAPVRIGLTATVPSTEEKRLTTEGLFGPVIAELNVREAVNKGILVPANVHLHSVPYDMEINKKGGYKFRELYDHGIVHNKARNKIIYDIAKNVYNNNGSVLILVERIQHGETLRRKLKKLKVRFAKGGNKDKNKLIKKRMEHGKYRVVIATRVWKEGINIPTLTDVINAAGYKDEKGVIQALGRGLRTSKGKKVLQFHDFLDPYRFLAEHAIQRLQIYKREGWI